VNYKVGYPQTFKMKVSAEFFALSRILYVSVLLKGACVLTNAISDSELVKNSV